MRVRGSKKWKKIKLGFYCVVDGACDGESVELLKN